MKHYTLFRRVLSELLGNYRKEYVLHLVNAIAERSGTFINILYMARVLQGLSDGHYDEVRNSVIEYLVLFGVLQLIHAIVSPILKDRQFQMQREISAVPYEKTIRMDFHYADQAETHDKLHQINRDMVQNNSSVARISEQLFQLIEHSVSLVWALILLVPLFSQGTSTVGGEVLAWLDSYWLNLAIILLVIISVVVQSQLMQRVYAVISEQSDQSRETNALYYYMVTKLHDSESGKEIRLYNLKESLRHILERQANSVLTWYRSYYGKSQTAVLISNFTSQLITLALYSLIGIRVLLGGLPIALVVQLSGALSQLIAILPPLMGFLAIFSQTGPLERYYDLMDYPEEVAKGSIHVEKRLDNEYQLATEALSFSYPGAAEASLKHITQTFEVGKKYAIVGENGSGKTTFIKVLMRLYEASQGEVLMNQIAVNKYNLSDYYQIFSVVFQDYRLLSFKLGQNLAVQQTFDEELASSIMDEVGLGELLTSLPAGLSTYMGKEFEEEGVSFSGGQTQKIAMARALYKDAAIMILDEPTAALDPVAEFEIYQQFSQIAEGKTAFYISHRLSSCRFCDEVLVFDQGEVVQRGSHEDLVHVPGKYRDLWQAQAQYYV